jgi:hypothetical protein
MPPKEVSAMTQSLTDWLQQSRMVVIAVDPEQRRIRVRAETDGCSDLACADTTVVMTEDGPGGLEALNAGDVIRIQDMPGAAQRIVVVRRVWDELTSPEW